MFVLDMQGERGHQLAFSPDSRTLAVATFRPVCFYPLGLWIWDLAERKVRAIHKREYPLYDITFTPDGSAVATADGGSLILLWGFSDAKQLPNFTPPAISVVHTLERRVDGSSLLAGLASEDGNGVEVRELDLATGRDRLYLHQSVREGDRVLNLSINPRQDDRAVLAGTTTLGNVIVWGRAGETASTQLPFPDICRPRFAPDGRTLAILGGKGVHVWDADTRTLRATWTNSRMIQAIAFSPDSRVLAGAFIDGTVRFWDAGSGQERAAFDWGIGPVTAVAFAPNGMTAAAAGKGGIVVWDVET